MIGFGNVRRQDDSLIDFWDIKTRKHVRTARVPECTACDFSPDSASLLTASRDGKLRLLRGRNWAVVDEFDFALPGNRPSGIKFLPGGKRFISICLTLKNPQIHFWDLETHKSTPLPADFKEQATSVAVSADASRLALAYAFKLELWDAERLQVLKRFEHKREPPAGLFHGVALSPDGKWIATSGVGAPHRQVITLWDAFTLEKLHQFDALPDAARRLIFTKDSKLLLTCTGTEYDLPGRVFVWDFAAGKIAADFAPGKAGCPSMALSPDNRWLATCGMDSTLRLWDFEKLRLNAK
ncbi:MAG: WD40 repeat domain-containing protein [Planctomycetes bacterium]|nr:WD40 repeat domain-containing protein [Planctomycetota bacterium]